MDVAEPRPREVLVDDLGRLRRAFPLVVTVRGAHPERRGAPARQHRDLVEERRFECRGVRVRSAEQLARGVRLDGDLRDGELAGLGRRAGFLQLELAEVALGEGLVFYPNLGTTPFDQALMFKAKGDKHRTAGKSAVQVDASVAASVDEFVALVVTTARLQQGLQAIGGDFDAKKTGTFLAWIGEDVKKESVAELEASKLTWAQVEKAVQQRARKWFLGGGL